MFPNCGHLIVWCVGKTKVCEEIAKLGTKRCSWFNLNVEKFKGLNSVFASKEQMADLDLGNIGVMLVPIAAVVINTVVKWAKNNVPS